MKKLCMVLLVAVLLASVILTGCGDGQTTTTATTTSTTSATTTTTTTTATTTTTEVDKYGGTLRIIYPYSPASTPGWPGDTTNPQKLWACWLTFEAIVKLDAAGEPHPWLATDWQWGTDNGYIDFNLRQDVKFHDGTDFTAESVVTHVNQLLTDADAATVNWDRIEKTGDYSFRLYLKLYMRDFWNNLAAWSMFITSDTALKTNGLEYVKENPIGTGPFKFVSLERDVALKFVKNENYWQPDKPYLDKIELYTTKEPLTQQAKMETGEGDVLVLQTGKILKDMTEQGFDLVFQTGAAQFIMFDTANEGAVTNDPLVRMAIEHAINKQEMADTLGYGYMAPNNQIPFTGNPAFNPNLGTRDYDVAKAKELLTQAGYPDGIKVKLISDTSGQDFAVMFQQYMAEANIECELEMIDNAKLWNYLFSGWEGMISASYAMGTNLPNFIRTYFPPIGAFDVSVKIPDDILEKCNAAMLETDDAKFREYSDEISEWIFDTAFFVPTVGVAMGYIIDPAVKDHDFLLEFVDFTCWSPENCWLDNK